MSTYNRLSFTNEEEKQLIYFIKQRRAIWDPSSIEYGNASLRRHYWKSISKQLNKKVIECRRKWRFIRDYYVHKRKPVAVTLEKPDSKYTSLSFLDKVVARRQKFSNIADNINEEHLEEHLENISDSQSDVGSVTFESSLNNTEITINEIRGECSYDSDENDLEKYCNEDAFKEILFEAKEQMSGETDDEQTELKNGDELDDTTTAVVEESFISKDLGRDKAIDLFFESMAATVKTFPANLVVQAKMKVFSAINELEEQLHSSSQ